MFSEPAVSANDDDQDNSGEHKTELIASNDTAQGRQLAVSVDGALSLFDLPTQGRLVIGRSSECDIVLDHASISRKHATLTLTKEQVTVEDLGSANGTTLAGKRLSAGVASVLAAGVVLEIGRVLGTLRDASPSAEPWPKPSAPRGGQEHERQAQHKDAQPFVVFDPKTKEALKHVEIAASSSLSVLLLGETGVGKELFARRLHELSPRRDHPLIRVNCAALVESLLEAELFGYERGAFTGATQAKAGLIEAASGGTLFLDEIGEMPLATQAKLLRALESGEVTRVGSLKPRPVDVRFVSATHRDLRELVASGKFREDLFFRLDGVSIRIPPLRERPSEILPLAEAFIRMAGSTFTPPKVVTLSDGARARLSTHPFPGNVRELKNIMQRSVLYCTSHQIEVDDLRFDSLGAASTAVAPTTSSSSSIDIVTAPVAPVEVSGDRGERRRRVIEALDAAVWNQTRAAAALGISRRTLQSWMIDLQIPRPRVRGDGGSKT